MNISCFVAACDVILRHDHIEVLSYTKICAEALTLQGNVKSMDDFKSRLVDSLSPLGSFVVEFRTPDGAVMETFLEAAPDDDIVLIVRTTDPDFTIH